MDKSLKVGEDDLRERERRGTKFMPQMRSEL